MSGIDKIEKILDEYKSIYDKFLDFIRNDEDIEDNFYYLNQVIEDTKIRYFPCKVKLFLRILLKVANNHNRGPNFFIKIERVLQIFKDDIKKYYSNSEIFNFFKHKNSSFFN